VLQRGHSQIFTVYVEDVNYDKSKPACFRVIFGRATPVELDFGQVEKGDPEHLNSGRGAKVRPIN